MCFSKIPNCKCVNNNSKNNADDDDDQIITTEKGEAYHLVPKSILLLNIRVIWKVNIALDLVQSFELNNDGKLRNTFVSWSLAVKLGMHLFRKFP